ncbi:hypothetical protein EVAR_18932_1 [Eumeta japonica]|uniref:Uncharacterized protein n=1 Tax=Eumeta variegata TaxID=151549 RepID=A0A4C1V2N0_EUMVA|nr:hypothetical protein EVAR_18932_1 [Eumeta japonica]
MSNQLGAAHVKSAPAPAHASSIVLRYRLDSYSSPAIIIVRKRGRDGVGMCLNARVTIGRCGVTRDAASRVTRQRPPARGTVTAGDGHPWSW